MLIRFVINNLFSFGLQREFNMIPNSRLKTLANHKYEFEGFELLKLASIYGANAAGKSNIIKSLDLFKKIVTTEEPLLNARTNQFKLRDTGEDPKQVLAIEFIQDNTSFYYAIEILNGTIVTEELYESGLGKTLDKLIYERQTDPEGKTAVKFMDDFENDDKSQILKQVLLEDFIKPDETILKLISNRENEYLKSAKKAFKWFSETLNIINPGTQPIALAQRIEQDAEFKSHAEDIMCSFHVGITSISTEKIEINEFFGDRNKDHAEDLTRKVEESKGKMIALRNQRGEEVLFIKENDKVFVKQLQFQHKGKNDITANFDLTEESDGTLRLLNFVPAFNDLSSKHKVYVIDEIERSIHPLLIKELVRKFSSDEKSLGQLIFTTHESNLLDQDLFRQDEIWFAEKDKNGVTDLYSLSDFKEHKTIDIRKGYLNGRYGSIPFLANLQDLNWHKNDSNQ